VRVVTVIPSMQAIGGLERVGTTLALEIAPRVERLTVCYAHPGPFEQPIRDAGIELVRIRRPSPPPHRLLPAAVDLARVLRRERPDVVHAHNPAAGVAARIARTLARLPGTAIVASFHGVHFEWARFTRVTVRAADVVIGVGPTSTQGLGLPPGRAVTVPNAVVAAPVREAAEVRAELGAADAQLVVNVARYVGLKNQRLLLDALARLAPERPRLRAALVGEGELRGELEAHAERLGLADRVSLLGFRADAVDVIAAADVFALSSDSEALPLTLLEAMTHGRPVVSTAVGSIPDAVADGESALLVPPGDVDAFSAALARLLDDPQLAARLGAAGRETVERRYSVGRMVERTMAVYESAIARRRRLVSAR
jgi:glycosyltransferase involved in cell wall biosynthesis